MVSLLYVVILFVLSLVFSITLSWTAAGIVIIYLVLVCFFIILSSIYFILSDELIIGSVQRRIGPFNLGWYGILSSILNGCNLIITQLTVPLLHLYFGFQLFPVLFFMFSIVIYSILYPFYLVNLMLSLILILITSSLVILFIILTAFAGNNKYSILGCIRIISQLIAFELIWTTILSIIIWTYNTVSVGRILVNSLPVLI